MVSTATLITLFRISIVFGCCCESAFHLIQTIQAYRDGYVSNVSSIVLAVVIFAIFVIGLIWLIA